MTVLSTEGILTNPGNDIKLSDIQLNEGIGNFEAEITNRAINPNTAEVHKQMTLVGQYVIKTVLGNAGITHCESCLQVEFDHMRWSYKFYFKYDELEPIEFLINELNGR